MARVPVPGTVSPARAGASGIFASHGALAGAETTEAIFRIAGFAPIASQNKKHLEIQVLLPWAVV